ncbi:hypothetical protein M1534_01750 [Patescibacteria group bacterium]|nr:hypothetical protein [Patescibacteria group bacterium]
MPSPLLYDITHAHITDQEKETLSARLADIQSFSDPAFAAFEPDIPTIITDAKKFAKKPHIIIIGNGGSVTAAQAFWGLARERHPKVSFHFLTTPDPLAIKRLKKLCPKTATLVLAISKSGETVNVIEELTQFGDYTIAVITQQNTPLFLLAQQMKWHIFIHPNIGGRFTARTVVGYLPAQLMGLNIKQIEEGFADVLCQTSNKQDRTENNALDLAVRLFLLEQKGFTEIFLPVYASTLWDTNPLITQLFHETICKNGKGQTVLALAAPESQHHSNQRFFGGPRNMAGLLVTSADTSITGKVKIPAKASAIAFREGTLKQIDHISLHDALLAEARGTFENAVRLNIPIAQITVQEMNEYALGYYIGFFQMVSIFGAWLRGNNAFDQPDVEASKEISWKEITEKNRKA